MTSRHRKKRNRPGRSARDETVGLRIVGGKFRGRKLLYAGDRRVRPMKDRTREAVFNLLGPAVRGMLVLDLFAGTGAMALEALSRGAQRAILVERHLPTARIIEKNAAVVGTSDSCQIITADAFRWFADATLDGSQPWLAFCCPPYDFYVDRLAEMNRLVQELMEAMPPGSALVVESDDRFDPAGLPRADDWMVRRYAPATVAIYWRTSPEAGGAH